VLNVGFYVPVGLALALTRIRWLHGVLAACLISLSMEMAQILVPGRVPSPLDLFTNTAGAALGLVAMRTAGRWTRVPSPLAGRLSLAAGVAFVGISFATGYFLAPEFQQGTYVGQWVPDLRRYQAYGGSVVGVSLGEHALPSRRLENSDQVRMLLVAGEPLRISAIAGPQPSSLSPIFGLVRQFRVPVLLVGVDGEDLVVRFRQRGAKWRLNQAPFYARGLMTGIRDGSELDIEVWRAGRRTCASVNERVDCALTPTIGAGWGLLASPASPSSSIRSILTFVWIALLAFPVGFWLRRNARSLAGPILVVAGAVLVPPLTSLAPTPPREWLAIAVGLSLGAVAHLIIGRLRA
jgi:hypothetical protein